MLPLAALPFPNIDPVIVRIGPLAVHWYGVAYVVGILFAWWYAKRLVTNARLWPDGTLPMKPEDLDDFLVWAAVGVVLGGRIGYVLFYDLCPLHCQSARYLRGLAGRHVVPWRLARRHPRHDPVCPFARHPHLDAVRRRRGRRAGGARPGAHDQLHQFGAVGPRHRCVVGRRLLQRAIRQSTDCVAAWTPSSEPALRGLARGAGAVPRAARSHPLSAEAEDAAASSPAPSLPAMAPRASSSSSSASRTSSSAISSATG